MVGENIINIVLRYISLSLFFELGRRSKMYKSFRLKQFTVASEARSFYIDWWVRLPACGFLLVFKWNGGFCTFLRALKRAFRFNFTCLGALERWRDKFEGPERRSGALRLTLTTAWPPPLVVGWYKKLEVWGKRFRGQDERDRPLGSPVSFLLYQMYDSRPSVKRYCTVLITTSLL